MKRLFNIDYKKYKYEWTNEGNKLDGEITKAVEPIIKKYLQEYDYIDVKYVVDFVIEELMLYKKRSFMLESTK